MEESEGGLEQRFLDQKHAGSLLSRLNELRKKEELCDVTILVNGTSIKAHRAVLAASSQYFNAMFTSQLSESSQNIVSTIYTQLVFFYLVWIWRHWELFQSRIRYVKIKVKSLIFFCLLHTALYINKIIYKIMYVPTKYDFKYNNYLASG